MSSAATNREEGRARIAALVENFERQLPEYHRGSYNETQTRIDFIDPFFKALGWDIDNSQGAAEAYREVIHEDKVKIGAATKAPDYSFRLPGGQRLFFVEAKKPSVKIKEEVLPAYQVRRYGWSAKLALSLLTDFEEFAVYDCTVPPSPTDKASKARLKYITFREYLTEFDWLWDTFSRQSVLQGNLDRFVATGSGKRGRETVDAAFLTTLEAMRASLAQGLATRNRSLDADELRFLVQMLLDRIIFLRIAEDRSIEPYGDLQAVARTKAKDGVYSGLLDRFRAAAARYNSGLFDLVKDPLTAKVHLDNAVLAPLLQGLYYPESPYEFSVIGAEILGSAYERFLGKVISLESGRKVHIADKPEVRKAGGVFYTPAYIVRYIVEHSLKPLCDGRTPQDVARLRVLDPACGSGSFLLGAYQFLLDWHLTYYQKFPKGALPPAPVSVGKVSNKKANQGSALTPDGRLSSTVKRAILLNNIFGVDLDSQAAEVTKLSLLLKCLEGETPASIQHALGLERVLPTIDQNIRVGNSLVETDFYDGEFDFDPEAEKVVKPFGWHDEFPEVFQKEGFDVVIGNPPYARVTDETIKPYLDARFQVVEGRVDLYELFLEKGMKLLKVGGRMGYIVPAPVLTNLYSAKLRHLLINTTLINQIISFKFQVFDEPTVHTCILLLTKENSPKAVKKNFVAIKKGILTKDALWDAPDYEIKQDKLGSGVTATIDIFSSDEDTAGLFSRMLKGNYQLGEICYLRQCIKTGDDKTYVKEFNQVPEKPWKPTLKGRSVARYGPAESNLFLNYGPWLARNWNNTSFYETEKIIMRETGSRLTATLDTGYHYVLSSLYGIYLRNNSTGYSHKFLLGLLNSSLATFFIKKTAFEITQGAFTKVRTNQLAKLPIPKLNLKTVSVKKQHDEIVNLVDKLLNGHAELQKLKLTASKEQTQAKLKYLDRSLDELVFDMYGLSKVEREFVKTNS